MFRFVSFRGRARVLLAAAGALSVTAAAHAELKAGYKTGEGASTSALIIDFAFIGGDSYYFEYNHDGTANAEQMLLDLDAAGDLDVDHQYFTFGGISSIYINGFRFDGNSSIPVFEGDNGENWSLYASDASTPPINWVGQDIGPTDRVLTDGSIDGWTLNVSSFNTKGLEPTDDAPSPATAPALADLSSQLVYLPVPEPTSAALLAFAGAVLMRRRRNA
jgi:hypothetical protein